MRTISANLVFSKTSTAFLEIKRLHCFSLEMFLAAVNGYFRSAQTNVSKKSIAFICQNTVLLMFDATQKNAPHCEKRGKGLTYLIFR